MKTIKTLFAVLFFFAMLASCESDSIEEEAGYIDNVEDVYGEDEADEVKPG